MPYATITGQLRDSDGTAWKQATWTAVPVSPSSKPVFPDGTPVPTTSGLLDDTGHFSGQMPQTIDIRPPGTTLTITITSMTSAPPVTVAKVQIVAANVDAGALLSPRIVAPRIKSGPINYAYNSGEITNPVHGNGYVNTYENVSYIYMQNSWIKIGASPVFDHLYANTAQIGTDPALGISDVGIPDLDQVVFSSTSDNLAVKGGFRFDGYNLDTSKNATYLTIYEDAVAGDQISFPTMSVAILSSSVGVGGHQANDRNVRQASFSSTAGEVVGITSTNLAKTAQAGQVTLTGYSLDYSRAIDYIKCTDDPAGGAPYRVTIGSDLHVNGVLSAGSKTFRIAHPADPGRLLIHGCLEGPENGVYYRGEAELVDGRAIVELPAYFEALTQADGRTVQLTQVFKADPGDRPIFSQLASSPVTDGKLTIYASERGASIFVSWEVKAERRDLPRLDVEPATKGERSEGEC